VGTGQNAQNSIQLYYVDIRVTIAVSTKLQIVTIPGGREGGERIKKSFR
jgi:hypothetical protein